MRTSHTAESPRDCTSCLLECFCNLTSIYRIYSIFSNNQAQSISPNARKKDRETSWKKRQILPMNRMASHQVISNAATILSSRRSLGPCWLLRCTTWRWYRLVQHGGLLGKFSWKNDKQSRYDSNMISMNITFKPGLVNYHSTGLTNWCKRNSYSDWLRGHKCHGLNRSFRSV